MRKPMKLRTLVLSSVAAFWGVMALLVFGSQYLRQEARQERVRSMRERGCVVVSRDQYDAPTWRCPEDAVDGGVARCPTTRRMR